MKRTAVALLLVASLAGAGGEAHRPRPGVPRVEAFLAADRAAAPSARRLAFVVHASSGGVITASTGETVNVFVSDSYAPGQVSAQYWADFFAGLVHGSELSLLSVYVEPPEGVQATCGGGQDVLGCYGGNRLVIPGEPVDGIAPEEIARHEYGHHVAANRSNAPWTALDSGPKRWASYESVCARASAGTAFPGDEGIEYRLNPGEAFAETYRLLNDARAGTAAAPWQVVDGSFYPDAAALSAVELDVRQPWTADSVRTIEGRFTARGPKTWSLSLQTPLDGELSATLAMPRGALYDLALIGPDGRVLSTGLWSGATTKTLSFDVCGQRAMTLRVAAGGRFGRFSLRIARP